jgi:hypothetical protein
MASSYPYIISNNKIGPILTKIRSAARPTKFSRETLATWGFAASNDRAMVGVLKDLGFLAETGAPTEYYDRLRDPTDWPYVLADRMRALYSDIYAIDVNIHAAPEDEIRGAISRVTGKDDESVKRYYATFKTLASLAKFDPRPTRVAPDERAPDEAPERKPTAAQTLADHSAEARRRPDFHYNIQIHLPVTTDISVYNAIFRSLKESLNI